MTSFLSTSHLLHLFLLLLLAIYCPPPSPAYLLLLSSLTFCIHFLSSDAPSTPPPTNPTLSPPQTALSVVFFPLFILQPSSFWLALMGGWRGDWKGMSTRREGGCRVMKGRVCDLSSVCVCERYRVVLTLHPSLCLSVSQSCLLWDAGGYVVGFTVTFNPSPLTTAAPDSRRADI